MPGRACCSDRPSPRSREKASLSLQGPSGSRVEGTHLAQLIPESCHVPPPEHILRSSQGKALLPPCASSICVCRHGGPAKGRDPPRRDRLEIATDMSGPKPPSPSLGHKAHVLCLGFPFRDLRLVLPMGSSSPDQRLRLCSLRTPVLGTGDPTQPPT